jgi:predicted anti-sigma-YlaC factor YlaD
VPQLWVEEHLDGCAACRGWAEAAAEVTRRARLVAAPPVPDVTAAVLARLPAPRARPRRHWLDAALRLALLAVAAGQLAVSLPPLAGAAGGDMAAPVHLAHETGAWNLGLAACFLGVAVLPRLAAGSLPFLLSFTAVLTWVTLDDLAAGHVDVGRAVGHVLLVVGAVLVSVLALRNRGPRGGPVGAAREWPARLARRRQGDRSPATAPSGGAATDWPRDATAAGGDRRAA